MLALQRPPGFVCIEFVYHIADISATISPGEILETISSSCFNPSQLNVVLSLHKLCKMPLNKGSRYSQVATRKKNSDTFREILVVE